MSGHISKFFIFTTLMTFWNCLTINSQTVLGHTIYTIWQYFDTDIDKAEKILHSIDTVKLNEEPDSIKMYYHYFSAAADEVKGITSPEKIKHLENAKQLCEESVGVGNTPYVEICWALGLEYDERKQHDLAIKTWEHALVRAVCFYDDMSVEQKKNWHNITEALKEEYRKKGIDKAADTIEKRPKLY